MKSKRLLAIGITLASFSLSPILSFSQLKESSSPVTEGEMVAQMSKAAQQKFVKDALDEATKATGTNELLQITKFRVELSKRFNDVLHHKAIGSKATGSPSNGPANEPLRSSRKKAATDDFSTKKLTSENFEGELPGEAPFNLNPTGTHNSLWMMRNFITGDDSIQIFPMPTPKGIFDDCVALGDESGYFGSGILVASNLVLTAGHIAARQPTKIFIGTNTSALGRTVEITNSLPIRYFGFTGTIISNVLYLSNDIAALMLVSDVSGVSLHPLASSPLIDSSKALRIAGFGATNSSKFTFGTKRDVSVPIECYRCDEPANQLYSCNVGFEIVAGDQQGLNDACFGDSGGPAYTTDGKKWYLAAVDSRAVASLGHLPDSTRCGQGNVYSRVDVYTDLLRQIVGVHWAVASQ